MSLFDRWKKLFTASGIERRSYWVHARCQRCGEVISARVDLLNDLSRDFDTQQFIARKTLMGDGRHRCFQRLEITLIFDKKKRLVDRSIIGGEFLHPTEVDEAKEAYQQALAAAKAQAEAERQANTPLSTHTHDPNQKS